MMTMERVEFEQQRRGRHGELIVSCAGHGKKRKQDMDGSSVSMRRQTGRGEGRNGGGMLG